MANRRSACLALVAALMMLVWSAPQVLAQAKADATGTWKWEQAGRGGGGGGGRRGGAPGGGAPATQPGGGAAAAGGAPGGGRRGGGRGGTPIEITATLKQDGEKLTGSVLGMNFQDPTAKTDISDGSVKPDGTVSFKVVTTGGRGEITRIYTGKLEGDKITGTSSLDFGGGAPGGAPGGGGAANGGGGAPGGGAAAPGGGRRGGGGFGGPQDWTATRSK